MSLLLLAQIDTTLHTALYAWCDASRSRVDILLKVVNGTWVPWYTNDFRWPRKKNLRAWGPVILVSSLSPTPNPSTSFAPRQRNEAVLHPAERKADVVRRVVLHACTVRAYHSKTGDIVRRLVVFPVTPVPLKCFPVSRTTPLWDSPSRLNDDYLLKRIRVFFGKTAAYEWLLDQSLY